MNSGCSYWISVYGERKRNLTIVYIADVRRK
jgi:hypothetical protein